MQTRIDEIGADIYRLSIFAPEVVPPAGFTFEPMFFHCGLRKMFSLVSEAVARIVPVDQLRWLIFGHFEADECGSMNEWLAAAPHVQLAHGVVGCRVSVADMADRPPRVLSDGEVVDIGGKRLRYVGTPHVSHGWDAGLIFEETTQSLFCGDLFAHLGNPPALAEGDIIGPAMAAALTGSLFLPVPRRPRQNRDQNSCSRPFRTSQWPALRAASSSCARRAKRPVPIGTRRKNSLVQHPAHLQRWRRVETDTQGEAGAVGVVLSRSTRVEHSVMP